MKKVWISKKTLAELKKFGHIYRTSEEAEAVLKEHEEHEVFKKGAAVVAEAYEMEARKVLTVTEENFRGFVINL